jgi:hypothetical protein
MNRTRSQAGPLMATLMRISPWRRTTMKFKYTSSAVLALPAD